MTDQPADQPEGRLAGQRAGLTAGQPEGQPSGQPGGEPAGQLGQAVAVTGELIAALRPQDWQAATVCDGWQVADIVQHLVTGQYSVAARLAGQPLADVPPAGPQAAAPPAGDALAAAYRDSAGEMLAAFRQPGALQRMLTVPFGTVPGIVALNLRLTELLVHGWDIARAAGAGAAPAFPAGLAEQALAFAQANIASVPPERRPFAPPRPAPDSAPAIDRLAALLGRPVTVPRPGPPG